jgi:hypothetical protein
LTSNFLLIITRRVLLVKTLILYTGERVDINSNIPAMRFLGVFFDPALNFKYHVQKIMSKLSRALYILRTVKNLLTPHTLKSLYYTLFHCHLIYAMPIWTICNLQLQKDLHIKQKNGNQNCCWNKVQ